MCLDAVADAGPKRGMVLDLENLTYISSAALRVLLGLTKAQARKGGTLYGLLGAGFPPQGLGGERIRSDHSRARLPGRGSGRMFALAAADTGATAPGPGDLPASLWA